VPFERAATDMSVVDFQAVRRPAVNVQIERPAIAGTPLSSSFSGAGNK
jgi:hypothetical protein